MVAIHFVILVFRAPESPRQPSLNLGACSASRGPRTVKLRLKTKKQIKRFCLKLLLYIYEFHCFVRYTNSKSICLLTASWNLLIYDLDFKTYPFQKGEMLLHSIFHGMGCIDLSSARPKEKLTAKVWKTVCKIGISLVSEHCCKGKSVIFFRGVALFVTVRSWMLL